MSSIVYVTTLPDCDFCRHPALESKPAKYDFRTSDGRWANGCEEHYLVFRMYDTLGTGKGQELRKGEEPEESDRDKRKRIMAAIESGDFDTAEEIIGDGDPAEWL